MYDVLHAFISNSNLKIVVDHCLLKYLTVHKTLSTFLPILALVCYIKYTDWIIIELEFLQKKNPQKIKKKKSKIFKNQKKEIQNFQKSKKEIKNLSKIKKKKSKTQKNPKNKTQTDFIAHLITYVCIEIILMFLYSFVCKHWSLISNYVP